MIKHHSYKIQNVIQRELFAAKHSIKICMAWFTNDLLFQPLLLKLDAGVEVAIITNKDEINFGENHDVNFDEFIQRGGCIYWNERGDKSRLLHHKFCIIDDSIVISGSYNWTNGAEYNDEDITIFTDEQETIKHYSEIFDKLAAKLPKSLMEVQRTERKEGVILDLRQRLQARYCEIGEYIDGLARVCRATGGSYLWGFVDEQGEEVVPCRYNSVAEFNSGLSFVCLGHYFGAIDRSGAEIIPFQHNSIRWRDKNFIEAYLSNDELCIYDNSGARIEDNRIIVYTSVDGTTISPNSCSYRVLSNTYNYDLGIIIFSGPIKQIFSFDIDEYGQEILAGLVSFDDICENVSFYQCQELLSIVIPNGVKEIHSAFYNCNYLKNVYIPNSITIIGNNAFHGCRKLESVTIPNSVTKIGSRAFSDCSSLTSITISNSVTEIDDYAFSGCKSLIGVTIPNSVINIGSNAFMDCSSLTSITIPNSVTEIGNGIFGGCYNIREFEGKFATDDGCCLIKDNTIIAYAGDSGSTYIIPNDVTAIGSYAFRHCSSLLSITIPNSVKKIGWGAYMDCSSLTSVTIPNSVTEIEAYAFYGCKNLISIMLSKSITTISDSIFKDCCLLTNIAIPNDVTAIGRFAFENCTSLTSVTVPNSVTEIGYRAFCGCCNIKGFKGKFEADGGRCLIKDNTIIAYAGDSGSTYTIPKGVTKIEYGAFRNCSSLLSVTIPESISEIDGEVFNGCCNIKEFKGKYASDDGRCLIKDNTIIAYAEGSGTKCTIPSGVAQVDDRAFINCTSLRIIKIPDSVTEIGDEAFRGCISLIRIVIPDSVTTIGQGAFMGCSSLTSISIPASVAWMGMCVFSDCIALKSIYCKPTTPPYIYPPELMNSSQEKPTIYVASESVDAYKNADGWSEYRNAIVEYDAQNRFKMSKTEMRPKYFTTCETIDEGYL